MIRSAPSRRLGDASSVLVAQGAQIGGAALSTVGVLASSSVGVITLSSTLAAAIPVAGAVIAVGVIIFSLLHNSRGLQQNVETTQMVNKAAVYMQSNLDAWNASSKNFATQAAALKNFDDAWQAVLNFCGQASEGSPGERCISERQKGGKYDFFSYWRDPIANDPHAGDPDRAAVVAAAALAAEQQANQTAALSPSTIAATFTDPQNAWLIPAALVLAAVLL